MRNNCAQFKYIIMALNLYALSAAIIFAPSISHANGLGISPKRIVFEDDKRVMDVALVNSSSLRKSYDIIMVNKKMDQSGRLLDAQHPANGEFFASNIARFSPRSVEIGPGQTQKIRILSKLSNASPDGEYRSHMVFKERGYEEGNNQRPRFAISIPIIMRKGELKSSFHLSNPKRVTQEKDTFITFDLNREGNKSIFGNAEVFVGETKIGTLKGIAAYLSTPIRLVRIKIDPQFKQELDTGKTLKIVFETAEKATTISHIIQ